MLSDFRFAARQLLKTPGFTGAAVLMLGLALGANSAVFSLAEGLVLRPIVPYQPGDVVSVFTSRQDAAREYRNFSHAEFLALRAAKGVFADVAALRYAQAGIGSEGNIRRSFAIFTSENFFTLCGAPPAAGRYYSAGECLPNADIPVAVASYPLWRRMGGGPDFVGSTLRVNGRAYTVIGVSPRDFNGVNALVSPSGSTRSLSRRGATATSPTRGIIRSTSWLGSSTASRSRRRTPGCPSWPPA
jgi:hypothetical protein